MKFRFPKENLPMFRTRKRALTRRSYTNGKEEDMGTAVAVDGNVAPILQLSHGKIIPIGPCYIFLEEPQNPHPGNHL
jgi:hypothetical protein